MQVPNGVFDPIVFDVPPTTNAGSKLVVEPPDALVPRDIVIFVMEVPAHLVVVLILRALITVFDARVTILIVWVVTLDVTACPDCPVTVHVVPNGLCVMVYLLQVPAAAAW